MGIYVLLLKEHEDDSTVIYRFGPRKEQMGRARLDKRTQTVRELAAVPGVRSSRFYFEPAASRMFRWFVAGEGFPEKGSYQA